MTARYFQSGINRRAKWSWRQVVQYSSDVYGCHPSEPTQHMIECVNMNAENGFALDIMLLDYWSALRDRVEL